MKPLDEAAKTVKPRRELDAGASGANIVNLFGDNDMAQHTSAKKKPQRSQGRDLDLLDGVGLATERASAAVQLLIFWVESSESQTAALGDHVLDVTLYGVLRELQEINRLVSGGANHG